MQFSEILKVSLVTVNVASGGRAADLVVTVAMETANRKDRCSVNDLDAWPVQNCTLTLTSAAGICSTVAKEPRG